MEMIRMREIRRGRGIKRGLKATKKLPEAIPTMK
jgi:hypothetical protein